MSLNERLRELRQQASLTQEALAARMGVSKGTIANIETGTRQPSVEVLELWLKGTGGRMEIFSEISSNDPLRSLTDAERHLLLAFRGLDELGCRTVLRLSSCWNALNSADRRTVSGLLELWNASVSSSAAPERQEMPPARRRAGA